jgi:hypothetical protein
VTVNEGILGVLLLFGTFVGLDLRAIRNSLKDIHETLSSINDRMAVRGTAEK